MRALQSKRLLYTESHRNGYQYRCVITDSAGNTVTSNACRLLPVEETWTYTYDANGMRTKRTNGYMPYSYIYIGSQLTQLTVGSNSTYITYDASNTPMTITYNKTVYYYVTNLQGDVTAILNASGTAVVEYTYDAWGNPLSITGSMADTLGQHNPLRYRGYVYDPETGLYYLQSRYYNPELGRFINGDSYASTGQGFTGNNMFVYCLNNPVNGSDPCGTCLHRWDFWNDCEKCGGATFGQKVDNFFAECKGAYEYVTNSDTAVAQDNLINDGFTFYKGAPVFSADLPFDGSAFSFGVIVLDTYYENIPTEDFSTTLNHEYGHVIHFSQIGAADYLITTALPSLVGAGLANVSPVVDNNYYNLPWERTADYLGQVNRGYASYANSIGTFFWIGTILVSQMTPF